MKIRRNELFVTRLARNDNARHARLVHVTFFKHLNLRYDAMHTDITMLKLHIDDFSWPFLSVL